MAFKYQRGGVWWIGTRRNGKLIRHSTGESDKAKADKKLAALQAMEAAQRAGKLDRQLFEALTGTHIEAVELFASLDTWISEIRSENTRANYKTFAAQFKAALPHNPALADITHEQVRTYLAGVRAEKRASTANLRLKQAKAFFSRYQGALRKDPTEGIPAFKETARDSVDREPFTPDQIKQVMAIAPPFWRCAAALSFYTGLRLSDVAMLKVGNLKGDKVTVATAKTGEKICVNLPASIAAMIREDIPPSAGSGDYVWPEQAKHAEANEVTNLSGQFATLLVNAGLRKDQVGAGNGKTGRRTLHSLSFHSLRHSLVSALANSGVNQQVVKKFVGHGSTRINDAYTHIGQDALDRAVALLPDITERRAAK
jgi:integrase